MLAIFKLPHRIYFLETVCLSLPLNYLPYQKDVEVVGKKTNVQFVKKISPQDQLLWNI